VIQPTSVASRVASNAPSPPTTTSVSIAPRIEASDRSATMPGPRVDTTGPASAAATMHSYAPVAANTSCGPTRSSAVIPG